MLSAFDDLGMVMLEAKAAGLLLMAGINTCGDPLKPCYIPDWLDVYPFC